MRFFAALRSHEKDEPHPSVREAVARYSPLPFEGGGYYEARRKIQEMPSSFTFAMLKAASPGISEGTLKKALKGFQNYLKHRSLSSPTFSFNKALTQRIKQIG